jgi:aspartate/glutamate racemase
MEIDERTSFIEISGRTIRTSGMIGGLGTESSVDDYRFMIARFRALKPDGGYPHMIINSLDVDKGIALLDAGRLGELADYLTTGVELLVRAGADFGFIAANSRISFSMRSSAVRQSLFSALCASLVTTPGSSA